VQGHAGAQSGAIHDGLPGGRWRADRHEGFADAGREAGPRRARRRRRRLGRRLLLRRRGLPIERGARRRAQPADAVAGQRARQVRERPARLEQHGRVLVHVVHQEDALAQAGEDALRARAVEALAGRRSFETVEQPGLVALGLQAADEPAAGVREPLVVEVHRVLSGEHDAEPVGARLLQQREHRQPPAGC